MAKGMVQRAVLLAGAMALAYPLGLLLGPPGLLPVLNSVPAYAVMVERLRAGDRRGAVVVVLVWAAALALLGTLFFALWPTAPDARVLHGPAYRDEMFTWIRTAEGSEGHPSLFLPQHLTHLALMVGLSLATASALSIFMGAVLMNYMDFYVASLWRAGVPASAVALLGWQPYALCRVAAFCILGAILAEPLLSRLAPYPYAGLRYARGWLAVAGAGILLDWTIKAAVAPSWGRWLRPWLWPS